MKIQLTILMVALLALIDSSSVAAQGKADTGGAKILALESKWNDAYKVGDVSTMESLLSDDIIITVEDGSTFSKSGYLAHTADSALKVQISDLSDLKVRIDRKSTRLNSSHTVISYAVFCLKKK